MLFDDVIDVAIEAAIPVAVKEVEGELAKAGIELSPEQKAKLELLVRDVLANAKEAAGEFVAALSPEQLLKLVQYLIKQA